MNSSSTGRDWRPSARAKSAMNMNAPLSTPTSSTLVMPCVVGRDLLGQLLDLVADLLLGNHDTLDVGVVPGVLRHRSALSHGLSLPHPLRPDVQPAGCRAVPVWTAGPLRPNGRRGGRP